MKILQIVHGFPPESIAGTETYAEALTRCLLTCGHECTVLAGSWRSAPQPTLEIVEKDGLFVTRYRPPERRPRRWTEEYDPEAEGLVRHLLAVLRPDLVHLHHWLYLTNNLVAICTDLEIPVVVTLHDAWTSCARIYRIRWDGTFCAKPPAVAPCASCAERGPWQDDQEITSALALRQEMMEIELAMAAVIIVPSETHRRWILSLLDLPQERLIVLPHGSVLTVTPNEGRKERLTFPSRPLQIGHWGNLMYEKGTHLILEAVHKLRDPSVIQVHLIGTPVGQGYEQRLRELACGISVQFHGAYRPTDLQAFDLDLAVFASITSESYSLTLDEALRLELPVLVADRGAFAERIGGAGLTFRAGDAEDLARRLQEILDAPQMLATMRRGIRPDALFSMEAHVAMLEKIYEDAVHAHTPKREPAEPATPYHKLIAHAQQQVRERDAELARLQTEFGALSQSCHETNGRLAALEATAAALAQEREAEVQARLLAQQQAKELDGQLRSVEETRGTQIQECERTMGALVTERDDLMRRLTECERTMGALVTERDDLMRRLTERERTMAARLQALLSMLIGGNKKGNG